MEYKEGKPDLQRSFVYPVPFPLTSLRGTCKLGSCCLCLGALLHYPHSFMHLEQEPRYRANVRQLSAGAERHVATPVCEPVCRVCPDVGCQFVCWRRYAICGRAGLAPEKPASRCGQGFIACILLRRVPAFGLWRR